MLEVAAGALEEAGQLGVQGQGAFRLRELDLEAVEDLADQLRQIERQMELERERAEIIARLEALSTRDTILLKGAIGILVGDIRPRAVRAAALREVTP